MASARRREEGAPSSSGETGETVSHFGLPNPGRFAWRDSELPITGSMQAQLPGMLRREAAAVTLHSPWTQGRHQARAAPPWLCASGKLKASGSILPGCPRGYSGDKQE